MSLELTEEERRMIADVAFIKKKRLLISKIDRSFLQIQSGIEGKYFPTFDQVIQTGTLKGKVSRGENLEEMPYLVLDCPSVFDKTNIFTCRLIFWWGHFFGFHWLITGKYLNTFKEKCLDSLDIITGSRGWVGIANDPWDHNIGGPGYRKPETMTSAELEEVIQNGGYLKLSWSLSLEKYPDLETFVFNRLDNIISIVSK